MKSVFSLACFVALLALWGCHSKKNEEVVPVYTATTPLVDDVSLPQSYVGNIVSLRNIDVRSQQDGILQDVYVGEGQAVKAGQLLFRIAILGANEEIAKAKAEAEQAKIELQNATTLTENKIVSTKAQRMAQAKYHCAAADYRLALFHKRL